MPRGLSQDPGGNRQQTRAHNLGDVAKDQDCDPNARQRLSW
jgi:hypothetical protein